jgi:hypothetical protein
MTIYKIGRRKNITLATIIGMVGILFSVQVLASYREGISDGAFAAFSSELDRIEKGKHTGTAIAEIGAARKMIADGRRLFREGSIRRSAIIVERLPVQITLIRALIGAETALHDAQKMERNLRAMRRSLEMLHARYTKMLSLVSPGEKGEKK